MKPGISKPLRVTIPLKQHVKPFLSYFLLGWQLNPGPYAYLGTCSITDPSSQSLVFEQGLEWSLRVYISVNLLAVLMLLVQRALEEPQKPSWTTAGLLPPHSQSSPYSFFGSVYFILFFEIGSHYVSQRA